MGTVGERLAHLRVAPLEVRLETRGVFRAPEFKGALFRGGFGKFFRELVCVTGAEECKGCPHLFECRYSTIFESPIDPAQVAVMRKYPNAPHPFVLSPPLDARTEIPAGARLELRLTLIGRGIDHLPHFLVVLDTLGRSGRFGGAFVIR